MGNTGVLEIEGELEGICPPLFWQMEKRRHSGSRKLWAGTRQTTVC